MYGEREKERETEREKERETKRQTDRQGDGKPVRQVPRWNYERVGERRKRGEW